MPPKLNEDHFISMLALWAVGMVITYQWAAPPIQIQYKIRCRDPYKVFCACDQTARLT